MAALDFSTYDSLLAALADYLNRRDLTDQIPGFVQLTTAKANRILRVRDMQTRAEATTSGEYIPVPDDYLAPFSLELLPSGCAPPLEFISEDEAKDKRALQLTAPPQWYTIFGSEFELIPAITTDTNFKLKYYAKVPALSADNQTNWLLTKAPDFYLYGSLLEAAKYLKNDTRIAGWRDEFDRIVNDMNVESDRARFPQAKLVARRRGF